MSEEKPKRPVPSRARNANRKPSAGPGQGAGWGGPARGKGERKLIPGQSVEKQALSAAKAERREDRVKVLEQVLFDLALSAEREETRVSAATKLHAIYEGSPVARTITAQVDDVSRLNDDELRAELARLGRAASGAGQGAAPSVLSSGPADVVH